MKFFPGEVLSQFNHLIFNGVFYGERTSNFKPQTSNLPSAHYLPVSLYILRRVQLKQLIKLFAEIADIVEAGNISYLYNGFVGSDEEFCSFSESQVSDKYIDG